MKGIKFLVGTLVLSLSIFSSSDVMGQKRSGGGRANHKVESRSGHSKVSLAKRNSTVGNSKPQNNTVSKRKTENSISKEKSVPDKSSMNNHRGGNNTHRPEGNRPGNTNGNTKKPDKPNDSNGSKPNYDDKHSGNIKPNRPGNNHPGSGHNPNGPKPGNNSVLRPGSPSHHQPHHPNGKPLPPPPHNPNRWIHPLPPPPQAHYHYYPGAMVIDAVLGLTFGVMIDYSISELVNNGYVVDGYADNVVYLSNVEQLGYNWPSVTLYYDDGYLRSSQFQYWSSSFNSSRYNNLYNKLSDMYGNPVNIETQNGLNSVSWWGGNNTGYVTLQYGYVKQGSIGNYYTNLIYGSVY